MPCPGLIRLVQLTTTTLEPEVDVAHLLDKQAYIPTEPARHLIRLRRGGDADVAVAAMWAEFRLHA